MIEGKQNREGKRVFGLGKGEWSGMEKEYIEKRKKRKIFGCDGGGGNYLIQKG